MVLKGVFGQKTNAYLTKSTRKLIEYKMYLQALPYFDCLKGNINLFIIVSMIFWIFCWKCHFQDY
jgi:hypothetical protein